MSAPLSLVVIETESGAEVRLRDADQGERYPDVYAALDSLLSDDEFRAKEGILRSAGSPVGHWRWLDATAEEPAPLEDGSQVTRELIARMAARLNAGSPAPIDGISSEPHQQLYATGTHADGYAHVGAEVRDRSGRWHLFLYCELSPEAERVISAGLVWSGSIGFTSDGRLLQHALTNVPAVEGLRPNNATRHAARRVFTRSMRITMTQPTTSKRATLADAEAMLLELTGASAEDLGTVLVEMVAAHKAKVAEEHAEAADEKPEAEAMTADSPAARALPGFADDAAQEAFTSSVLGMLGDVFGKPEATPAELLEMLAASLAAFKGALGTAQPAENADAAMSAESADAAARSVEARTASLRSEVARLTAEIGKRDLRAMLAKRAADCKALVSDAELDQLAADVQAITDPGARDRFVMSALRAAQSVPTGEVFARAGSKDAHGRSLVEVAESLVPEVAARHPGEPAHLLISRAQRLARERFPHLA